MHTRAQHPTHARTHARARAQAYLRARTRPACQGRHAATCVARQPGLSHTLLAVQVGACFAMERAVVGLPQQWAVLLMHRPKDKKKGLCVKGVFGHDRMKARWEELILRAQADIIAAVEAEDGGGKFSEDAWTRPGGGGGISRVMQVAHQHICNAFLPLLPVYQLKTMLSVRRVLPPRVIVWVIQKCCQLISTVEEALFCTPAPRTQSSNPGRCVMGKSSRRRI